MKRGFLYCTGAALLLMGASVAWKTAPGPVAGTEPPVPAEKSETAAPTGKVETPARSVNEIYTDSLRHIYRELNLEPAGLGREVFNKAVTGFYNLKAKGKLSGGEQVLSIVDFDLPSREKRLWIIDLEKKELLFRTLVSHGKGSGSGKATRFSNREASHQSSLGFYVTGEVYYGKHGRSLRLDGMDPGFNNNARRRAIVLHGADYVSQGFIDRTGRLGRSFGCPAVPAALSDDIIDRISNKTVMFIHGTGTGYRSEYLNTQRAAQYLLPANG